MRAIFNDAIVEEYRAVMTRRKGDTTGRRMVSYCVGLFIAIGFTSTVVGSEVWSRAQEDAAGILRERVLTPLPRDAIDADTLPASFTWADHNGQSLVTKSLNQHIPQARPQPETCRPLL